MTRRITASVFLEAWAAGCRSAAAALAFADWWAGLGESEGEAWEWFSGCMARGAGTTGKAVR